MRPVRRAYISHTTSSNNLFLRHPHFKCSCYSWVITPANRGYVWQSLCLFLCISVMSVSNITHIVSTDFDDYLTYVRLVLRTIDGTVWPLDYHVSNIIKKTYQWILRIGLRCYKNNWLNCWSPSWSSVFFTLSLDYIHSSSSWRGTLGSWERLGLDVGLQFLNVKVLICASV